MIGSSRLRAPADQISADLYPAPVGGICAWIGAVQHEIQGEAGVVAQRERIGRDPPNWCRSSPRVGCMLLSVAGGITLLAGVIALVILPKGKAHSALAAALDQEAAAS